MIKLINSLDHIGVHDGLSIKERGKVIILNRYILLSLFAVAFLLIHNLILKQWIPLIGIVIGSATLMIPILSLQKLRFYHAARLTFVIGSLINIMAIALINIQEGRATNTSILIIGLSSIIPTLFYRFERVALFIAAVLGILIVEYYAFLQNEIPLFPEFYNSFINYFLTFSSVHFFIYYFRVEIDNHIDQTAKLNYELNENQNKLEHTLKVIEGMLNSTPVYLVLLNPKGQILVANRKFQIDFTKNENDLSGKYYLDIIPQSMYDKHIDFLEKSLDGKVVEFEGNITFSSGYSFYTSGEYVPVLNHKSDAVEYITVYFTDISKQIVTEKKLRDLNQSKDKLFSIIAHDLSGPILLLRDTLELHSKKVFSHEDTMLLVSGISEKVSTLSHMLSNLLNWAKQHFKGLPNQKEYTSIFELAAENHNLFIEIFNNKEITFKNECSEQFRYLLQKEDLNMIIRNLMSNALKFTENGGTITVSCQESEDFIVLIITDTGTGIDADQLQKLKNHSLVISHTGTKGETGLGIGLSLCSDLLTKNGWKLDILSEVGKGSIFKVEIMKEKEHMTVDA